MPRSSRSTARWSGLPSKRRQIDPEAEEEAAALRRETDEFIDARMAELRVGAAQDSESGRTARLGWQSVAAWIGDTMKLDRRAYTE